MKKKKAVRNSFQNNEIHQIRIVVRLVCIPPMLVDEKAFEKRAEQFHTAVAELAPVRSRNQITDLFNSFLQSRVGKSARHTAAKHDHALWSRRVASILRFLSTLTAPPKYTSSIVCLNT